MKIRDLIFQIESLSFDEVLKYLAKNAQKTRSTSSGREGKTFVVTINPEIIMLARGDLNYEKVLKSADLALVDGIGVIWAGKMFGKSFKGRVHGSDLVEQLSKYVAKKPITVGFLGGKENVAQKTAERLSKKYSGLKVAFATEEWPDSDVARGPALDIPPASARSRLTELRAVGSPSSSVTPRSINGQSSIVNGQLSCDILFVAFGSPKQEKWIYENLPKLDVRVAIGVGGSFDFISGKVSRAPLWVRNLGLEWLFRLLREPSRWKRQTALLRFVFLVLKEKLF